MSKPEIFVSIDIETDGPCPGLNSMIALGAVAYDGQENQLGTWYSTLAALPGCFQDQDTMDWWGTQPEAWAEVHGSQHQAWDMIPDFGYWCEALPGNPVAVAWPAVFDFAFVNYYLHRFFRSNPLGFAACDIRSYANGLTRHASYYGLPEDQVHALAGPIDTTGLRPHHALDDAIGQGRLFLALRRYALAAAAAEKAARV